MAYNQEMAEAQKICDRQMIRPFNCISKNKMRKIKFAKSIIQDLKNYGPAGVLHMAVLSNIIRKNIKILNPDGSLNRIIGKEKVDDTVEVEYHPTNLEQIGHWTLKSGKDPDNINIDLNSCLFSTIGSQTGHNPSDLRRWTVLRLKNNLQKFANLVDKIRSKGNDTITLMVGGARYNATSPCDVKEILDNSQGKRCHKLKLPAHPRGHTPDPSGTARTRYDCVEKYSQNPKARKTAFLSREDQDRCAYWMLRTKIGQQAIEQLQRVKKVTLNLCSDQIGVSPLPMGQAYEGGVPTEDKKKIETLTMVLCHEKNKFMVAEADLLIQTFYPVLDRKRLSKIVIDKKFFN